MKLLTYDGLVLVLLKDCQINIINGNELFRERKLGQLAPS